MDAASRFRVRMYGSQAEFRFIGIEGAPGDQIRLVIKRLFSLTTSFRLIEVRDPGPPVAYGAETEVHEGLRGAHEIIVDGKLICGV